MQPEPNLPDFAQSNPVPLLLVISGPSGVGKDAVIARLKERGYPFHFAITATTRPPRAGETHGREYYFVSVPEFEAMLAQNELLEHATVYNNYYGPPKAGVREGLAQGKDVILRIDVQGAETIKRTIPEAVLIFIAPPRYAELEQRLRARGSETPESLARRLAMFEHEMKTVAFFDYVVINRQNQLDQAVDDILAIIRAEKCRVTPRQVQI